MSDLGIFEIFSTLHEIVFALPLVFLAIGALYCFYGKEMFDLFNFLIGGFIALGAMAFVHSGSEFLLLLSAVASFLVGGLIGLFVSYFLAGSVGVLLGLGFFLAFSLLIGLIAGVLTAVVALLLFRFFLPALMALIGGGLVGSAVF